MRRALGWSLIELLVVLMVVTLLFSFGLPLGRGWYQQQYRLIIEQNIKTAIHQATLEALTRGEVLRLMPCLDCVDWSSGMALIPERYLNDQAATHLLYEWHWPQTRYRLSWHGFISQRYLRFSPALSQSAINGYFLLEDQQHQGAKFILNRLGRLRVEDVS